MIYEVELWAFTNGAVRKVDMEITKEKWRTDPLSEVLEKIFYWGQNDNQPQELPSVSVGDIARLGEERWLCCTVGWEKLDRDSFLEYTSMDKAERILYCLKHTA
jgi:hypothetical protein